MSSIRSRLKGELEMDELLKFALDRYARTGLRRIRIHCSVVQNGTTNTSTLFGRLVAENGKIKLLRDALNSFEVARVTVQDRAGLF
jgi:hypothetical protein